MGKAKDLRARLVLADITEKLRKPKLLSRLNNVTHWFNWRPQGDSNAKMENFGELPETTKGNKRHE